MNFQDIAQALVTTAKEEGLTVDDCNGKPVIRNGSKSMGLVVCGDYDLSFYFSDSSCRGRLRIQRETDFDLALSCGLDFIYA